MTPEEAARLLNEEAASYGLHLPNLTVEQNQAAFASLQTYAQVAEVPLEEAIRQVIQFQLMTLELENLRR